MTDSSMDMPMDKVHALPQQQQHDAGSPDAGSPDSESKFMARFEVGELRTSSSGASLNSTEAEGTSLDMKDMQRLGMKQEFIRRFRLISYTFFVVSALAGWQFTLFTMTPALIGGGLAGSLWSLIWSTIGFIPITLSLAEMSSMAPTAGAQYHWVSEFAPAKYQRVLSYYTGWYSSLAYQSGNASGIFLSGTLIQTVILLNDSSYAMDRWQGALLIIAVLVFTLLLNLYGTRLLPIIQTPLFTLNAVLFICVIVGTWVLAEKNSAKDVFTSFTDSGGWSNIGIAVLAGQLSSISANSGLDTAAHLAEEVRDASRTIPIVMMSAFIINFLLGFMIVLVMLFGCTDLGAALDDPTGYPALWVLQRIMSIPVLSAFIIFIIIFMAGSNMNYLAAVSRDLFAFGRDHGLPGSGWIATVHPQRHIPHNALYVSGAVATVLSLIYIGSPTAYYAVISLVVVSLLQCYMFSIGCVLWRRIYHPTTLPRGYWSLGRHGIWINSCALFYSVWAFFWAFWPQSTIHNGAEFVDNFNWAPVLFCTVFIIATVHWFVRARKVYRGPVVRVQGRVEGSDLMHE